MFRSLDMMEDLCADEDQLPYCEMIRFFFLRDDPRRQGVCDAMKLDRSVDCPVTQVDPKDRYIVTFRELTVEFRCLSENPYEFSWNFLRFAALEENGMEFFKTSVANKPDEFFVEFNNALKNNSYFNNVFHELREVQIVQSQLYLHFMISSLILNNLGKAARQTDKLLNEYCEHGCHIEEMHNHESQCVSSILHQHTDDPTPPKSQHAYMRIECNARNLYIPSPYTIGYIDLRNFVRTENVRCFIIFMASTFGIFMNIYMQQFYPVYKERSNVDFFRITNYTRYYDETYLAAVSALRLTLNDRYGDVITGNFTQDLHGLRILAIAENFLVNFSRSLAAMVMILIVCSVFYELRSSFCGRLRPKVKLAFILLIWFCWLTMLAMYVYIGSLEYNMIYHLNDVMGARGNDQEAIKRQCRKLRQEEHKKDQLKGHAYFMILYFFVSVVSLISLFAYHKYKVSRSKNGIPQHLQEEMQKSWRSLTIASMIYILSNFGTTFVEIRSLIKLRDTITQGDVQSIAELYRWLYLLSLIDPIVHPWILIYRMKALRVLHFDIQKELTSLQLKSILRKVSTSLSTFQKSKPKKQTRFDDEVTPPTPRRLRPSVQQDLQWMLNYLEREKRIRMGEL
ncbi:unnamed protein product [Bursaphelenchus xylophilus]|uniref:(pine wood nematode) hypothetical protein n=1 Tax=Bursaphelenchus xylophilus TaxID=6326 RepID=A0A1I7S7N2_BURXY|nr:unnamed protein product [Bursaphelenchus xylophilus]CAG9112020.1 unnamed protein product [Bursaphelenchus xylophilus]